MKADSCTVAVSLVVVSAMMMQDAVCFGFGLRRPSPQARPPHARVRADIPRFADISAGGTLGPATVAKKGWGAPGRGRGDVAGPCSFSYPRRAVGRKPSSFDPTNPPHANPVRQTDV